MFTHGVTMRDQNASGARAGGTMGSMQVSRAARPLVTPLTASALAAPRRAPGWFAAVVLATAVLVAARAAPPLVDDVAADSAFRSALDEAPRRAPWQPPTDAHGYVVDLVDPSAIAQLTAAIGAIRVYGEPIVTVRPIGYLTGSSDPIPTVRGPAGSTTAVPFHRTGAVEQVAGATGATGDPSASGVWLPAPVADAVGATAGSTVWLSSVPTRTADDVPVVEVPVDVAGVYPVVGDGPFPDVPGVEWSVLAVDLPDRPDDPTAVAPMVLGDLDTVLAVLEEQHERPLTTWDLPWEGPRDIETGRAAAEAFVAFDRRLGRPLDFVGSITRDAGVGRMRIASAVPDLVEEAEAVRLELAPLSGSLSTTGEVLGAALLGAAVWLSTRARRREIELAVHGGTRLGTFAGRSVLEHLAGVIVGLALGAAGAWTAIVARDPGASVSSSAVGSARTRVLIAAVAAVAIVALTAWHAAWSVPGVARGRGRALAGALRWEVVVAVAALATWWELLPRTDGALGTSAIVLFPIAAALTVAAITSRLTAAVVRRLGRRRGPSRRPRRHPLRHVVLRRLAGRIRDATPTMVIGASALAIAVFALSLDRAGSEAMTAKAASLGGARTVVRLGWSGEVNDDRPGIPGDIADATVVWRVGSIDAGIRERFDLQVVDPRSFAGVASWHRWFADQSPAELVAAIERPIPGDILPVIASGPQVDLLPTDGVMDEGLWNFRYRIVARVTTMPGRVDPNRGMLTVAAPVLFELLGDQAAVVPIDRADDRDGSFQTFFWSSRDSADVVTQLGELGLDPAELDVRSITGADRAARTPAFVAFETVAPLFSAIAVLALALGCAAPLLQALRARGQVAAEGVLMRSFGASTRAQWSVAVVPAVATAFLSCAVGIVTGAALVGFVVPRADTAARDLPGFVGEVHRTGVILAVGVYTIAALTAGTMSYVIARRATAEVLRAAD